MLPLLALALLLAACDQAEPAATAPPAASPAPPAAPTQLATEAPPPAPYPRSVVDSAGTEVEIDALPQRIISYSPAATEILFAIGAGERVVAADDFSNYPPEVEALPRLTYLNPDPEAALALEPDLVLMAGAQSAQVAQFRDLGLTVLFLEEPPAIEGIYEQIELLGAALHSEEQAAALVAGMRERVAAVTAAIADVENGPRVFLELDSTLFTVGTGSFVGGMLTALKAQNIAAGVASPFPQLSSEAVIVADPEVILLTDAAFGETPEKVAARPGWALISAVLSGRVHPLDGDLVSRPGPRIVEGFEVVARLLYPERFE